MLLSKLINRIIVCAGILLVTCTNSLSQGSWDIDYITIDKLDASYIGEEIRIDFKSSDDDTVNRSSVDLNPRKLHSKRDSIYLIIDDSVYRFIERWKYYVDHGSVTDQTLERLHTGDNEKVYIGSMILKSIRQSFVVLEVLLHSEAGQNKAAKTKVIVVDKSVIKGVLVFLRRN